MKTKKSSKSYLSSCTTAVFNNTNSTQIQVYSQLQRCDVERPNISILYARSCLPSPPPAVLHLPYFICSHINFAAEFPFPSKTHLQVGET